MRIRHAALALIAVVIFLPGCGSGKTGGRSLSTSGQVASNGSSGAPVPSGLPTGGKPLSKAKLIARADVICARLNAQLAAAKDVVTNDQATIAQIASRRSNTEQTALLRLRKLTPPTSLLRDWEQILAYRGMVVSDLAKVAEAAASNNRKAANSVLLAATDIVKRLSATAKRAGFSECGKID